MRIALALTPVLLVATTAATAQNPLVGFWKFDEAAGLTSSDLGPLGNHGSLVNYANNPTQWVAGRFGNALTFDGVDDYVDVTFGGGLPFFDSYGASFSVGMWIRGSPGNDLRVLSLTSSLSNIPLFSLGTGRTSLGNEGTLQVFQRSDDNATLSRYSDAVVFDNTWHHVAYIEHAGEGRLYVDGVLDTASFGFEHYLRTFTLDRLTFGIVSRSTLCCAWSGALDELIVYGYPLSQADVLNLMAGNVPSTCRASYANWGLGCGPGPLRLSVFGSPMLGGAGLWFTMRGGGAGDLSLLLFGLGRPAPLELSAVGLRGCYLYPPGFESLAIGNLGPFGSSQVPALFPVPNIPALACLSVTFQSASVGARIATSDAVLVQLGN